MKINQSNKPVARWSVELYREKQRQIINKQGTRRNMYVCMYDTKTLCLCFLSGESVLFFLALTYQSGPAGRKQSSVGGRCQLICCDWCRGLKLMKLYCTLQSPMWHLSLTHTHKSTQCKHSVCSQVMNKFLHAIMVPHPVCTLQSLPFLSIVAVSERSALQYN